MGSIVQIFDSVLAQLGRICEINSSFSVVLVVLFPTPGKRYSKVKAPLAGINPSIKLVLSVVKDVFPYWEAGVLGVD